MVPVGTSCRVLSDLPEPASCLNWGPWGQGAAAEGPPTVQLSPLLDPLSHQETRAWDQPLSTPGHSSTVEVSPQVLQVGKVGTTMPSTQPETSGHPQAREPVPMGPTRATAGGLRPPG